MTLELARKRRNQGDLIHELVEALERAVPPRAPEDSGYCQFCNVPANTAKHYPNCLYIEARAVLEKAKQLDGVPR
jgi:hypothetical protein